MATNPTAPATKEDIGLLMEQMGTFHVNLHSLREEMREKMATKEDLETLQEKMATKEDVKQSEHRMLVCMENMRQDLLDAHKDDLENVKIRLTRVERKVFPSRS